jgi:hypothetical protein
MSKTREELVAERDEHRSRLQELDATYAGQYLDPDSDDGKEFAERNEPAHRHARQDDPAARAARRDGRRYAMSPTNREEGATFQTKRSGVARGEDIFDLSTVRSSVTDPLQQGKEMRDRALRAVEAAHIAEIDHFDDAARRRAGSRACSARPTARTAGSPGTCSRSAPRRTSGRSRSTSRPATRR